MPERLTEPIKRAVEIDGQLYTLIISPMRAADGSRPGYGSLERMDAAVLSRLVHGILGFYDSDQAGPLHLERRHSPVRQQRQPGREGTLRDHTSRDRPAVFPRVCHPT
jgi:hypothetical protein